MVTWAATVGDTTTGATAVVMTVMGGRPGPARTWQGPKAISTAVVGGGANTCGAPMSALNRGRCTPHVFTAGAGATH